MAVGVLITFLIVSTIITLILALRRWSRQLDGFNITVTFLGEKNVAPIKATTLSEILDDGKGVLFTLTPVNKAGNPEPLPTGVVVSGSSSASASLTNPIPDPGDPTTTPPRPADTTGLVFLSTVPQPPVDATGIIVTFTAPFGSSSTTPLNVVADASPVGFSITEAAL